MSAARPRNRIIGNSPQLVSVLDDVDRVGPTTLPVLVLGESGVGKEVVARYLHDRSRRASAPFVVVNCAAIPRDLVESTLFGFEKGSFTGATSPQKGKLELADRGTVFLDEVGELPPDQQVKLLRVLQDGIVERIGGPARQIDIRIVAATNRDLHAMMREGRFREDLYYRLSGLEIVVPPLRDRGRDILMLAETILDRTVSAHALGPRAFSRDAKALIAGYRWPGNIRQLERVVETAAVLTRGRRITAADVARQLRPVLIEPTRSPDATYAAMARELLARDGFITHAGFRTVIRKSAAQTARILRRLVEQRVVSAVGERRWRRYVTASSVVATIGP